MIVALEGISGSGKTTLANNLVGHGFKRISELSERFDAQTDFPPFTIDTPSALITNEWFLRQECQRYQETIGARTPIVFDRNYHSIAAVSYSRAALFGTNDQPALYQRINHLLLSGELSSAPTVFIELPVEIALQRLHIRHNNDKELLRNLRMTTEFLALQIEYYEKSIPRQNRIDGALSVTEQAEQLLTLLQTQ